VTARKDMTTSKVEMVNVIYTAASLLQNTAYRLCAI